MTVDLLALYFTIIQGASFCATRFSLVSLQGAARYRSGGVICIVRLGAGRYSVQLGIVCC